MKKTFEHRLLPECSIVAEMIDGKRFYTTPEGNKYPSVTTILSKMSEKGIAEWRAKIGNEAANKISSTATRRGTKLHSIAENYVMNRPHPENVMPTHLDMFKPVQTFLDRNVDVILGCEIGLYSDELRLAGRCDLVCELYGQPTIVDFKTASKLKEEKWILNYFYQTTVYATMVEERHNVPVEQVCLLIMTENDGMQVFRKPTSDYKQGLMNYLKEVKHL